MRIQFFVVLWAVLTAAMIGCAERRGGGNDASDTAIDYFLLRSGEALEAGNPSEALRLARQALRADSNSARAAFVIGESLERLGRDREASAAFSRVTKLDPSFPDAWLRLGNLAFEKHDFRAAVSNYRREIALVNTADAWFNLGATYSALGISDSAALAFQTALAVEPDHAPSLRGMSDVSEMNGNQSDALVFAERALQLQPDEPAAQRRVALLYLREGKAEAAVELLESAIRRDGLDAEAHYSLGLAYQRLGRTSDAERSFARHRAAASLLQNVEALRRRLDADSGDLDAARRLALLLVANGRPDEAVVLFERILAKEPNDFLARTQLATALAIQGHVARAEREYRYVLDRQPEQASVWMYLGTLLVRNGRRQEGERALANAVRLDPKLEVRVDSLRHAL